MERLSEKAGQEVKKESGAWVGKGGMQQGITACRAKGAQKNKRRSPPSVAARLTEAMLPSLSSPTGAATCSYWGCYSRADDVSSPTLRPGF